MSQTPPSDLVQSVCEVTGTNEAEAKHLLAACNNDVEAAVALFFEGGGGASLGEGADDAEANLPLLDEDEDGVRAPIAPIREQLIGPEDDNFYAAAPPPRLRASTTRRVKVCPLRDFAREGALMEEQLEQAADGSGLAALDNLYEAASHSRSSSRRNRAADMVASAQMSEPKKSRLEDLFRPPTDIAFAGKFSSARDRAEALKQWLLVNVQSDNFDSQLLNRDVWSDKALRKLMKRQFLLWQVDGDSSEGRRFVAFYHCAKLPYVCVIDPRTGEEMWKCTNPKQSTLLNDLKQFLIDNKDFSQELEEDCGPSTSSSNKRSATAICLDSDDEGGTATSSSKYNADDDGNSNASSNSSLKSSSIPKKRNKIMELSEDEQIALAIRNSMNENGVSSGNGRKRKSNGTTTTTVSDDEEEDDDEAADGASDFGSVEEFQEDDTKSACERTSYEEQLGTNKDVLTMLKVRLINAEGADEVVQLRWPSDTKLLALRSYIRQCHSHIPKSGYKLICAFPRKALDSEHDACTLKEIGLHPSANLHITLDD
uniref:UAS domain-containing protein n=1 Tax=Stomoxys calcitrans TaxID=35570 RepID=A0A1I8PJ68_STOCA